MRFKYIVDKRIGIVLSRDTAKIGGFKKDVAVMVNFLYSCNILFTNVTTKKPTANKIYFIFEYVSRLELEKQIDKYFSKEKMIIKSGIKNMGRILN